MPRCMTLHMNALALPEGAVSLLCLVGRALTHALLYAKEGLRLPGLHRKVRALERAATCLPGQP